MDRAVYQHELSDPDFAWLLRTFQESNPDYYFASATYQPIALIRAEPGTVAPALLGGEFDYGNEEEESGTEGFIPPKDTTSD